MATSRDRGTASTASTFDAPTWLAAWADNGGIAINTGQRLFVGRLTAIDHAASRRLDVLREALLRRHGGEALAAHLTARAAGEVAS